MFVLTFISRRELLKVVKTENYITKPTRLIFKSSNVADAPTLKALHDFICLRTIRCWIRTSTKFEYHSETL